MFGRKKPERPKRDRSGNLAQFGLFDVPADFQPMGGSVDSDGGDSDLEAELAALTGGGSHRPQPKKAQKQPLPQHQVEQIVAGTLKDIDAAVEDEEVDEDDPALLSELQEITGEEVAEEEPAPPTAAVSAEVVDTLAARLKAYQELEKAAREAGEISKAKRFGRALKTLSDLLKTARAGGPVDLSDSAVPPEIQPKPSAGNHAKEQAAEVQKAVDEELLAMLLARQKEYKLAALQAKKGGNSELAINHLKIAKVFDHVIEAVKRGEAVDLSDMPGPPGEPRIQENERQQSGNTDNAPEPQPLQAGTIEEALQQRLEFYKAHEQQAKDEANSSKARRFGRIVKQFEQALKAHRAGKGVEFEELPTPPGFAAIPVPGAPPAAPPTTREAPPIPKPSPSRASGNKLSTTHQEKQVLILQAKQKQFKVAALNAKKKGELLQAKEFLKQAKGFDRLIEAAEGGLPVDWATIPVSPEAKSQLDNEYDIVMADECTETADSDSDLLSRLETQLTKQMKMCLSTRDHHKALGDVAGMNRFERLALNVTKDLDVVRVAKRTGRAPPKFHYETKEFSIVKSFTELTDNELELLIVRGINYRSNNPKDIDTYVKFEFPFPQDAPHSSWTSTVKDTNNPEYNQTFIVPIQRSSRQCQRVFKRHGIKFEVYSKGGLFRSDSLLGSVNLKLQPLETVCELHDSFELMDGRRKTGGKLEVRLRLRSPIVTQQVEQIQEKWLIVDQ
ncbi:coiled-coil and C2 domain-containing protein 1-like isoform X2 [Dendroctonus ponderosae]|nr:coiled-coil and C2 domain-containing protein 1-like isoform X2 [Dendroctonus ponderosae]KAH1003110.1 hypothetical protein HUJ05_011050 [Dendroctonus ponderosae]